jgi:ABC-type antimicrobial peptide transport system permease subunit
MEKSDAVMGIIFSVATYIAMGLCLFSLMASMYTNIFEQSKEIAILRAMGLRQTQIVKIYVYEAFTLTLAASLLGIVIGALMGWTMTAQRVLFTQLPITFVFPWTLLLLVILGAVACALLSSYMPARRLVRKSVASVFRTVI